MNVERDEIRCTLLFAFANLSGHLLGGGHFVLVNIQTLLFGHKLCQVNREPICVI